jgi:hypothetical protein
VSGIVKTIPTWTCYLCAKLVPAEHVIVSGPTICRDCYSRYVSEQPKVRVTTGIDWDTYARMFGLPTSEPSDIG